MLCFMYSAELVLYPWPAKNTWAEKPLGICSRAGSASFCVVHVVPSCCCLYVVVNDCCCLLSTSHKDLCRVSESSSLFSS